MNYANLFQEQKIKLIQNELDFNMKSAYTWMILLQRSLHDQKQTHRYTARPSLLPTARQPVEGSKRTTELLTA